MMLRIKRVCEPSSPDEGERIFVDRLWPRGLTPAAARIDVWLKDVAPSSRLRQWFHADASRWSDFRRRFRAELRIKAEVLAALRRKSARGTVTLLYAVRDRERDHAEILEELIAGRLRRRSRHAPQPA